MNEIEIKFIPSTCDRRMLVQTASAFAQDILISSDRHQNIYYMAASESLKAIVSHYLDIDIIMLWNLCKLTITEIKYRLQEPCRSIDIEVTKMIAYILYSYSSAGRFNIITDNLIEN